MEEISRHLGPRLAQLVQSVEDISVEDSGKPSTQRIDWNFPFTWMHTAVPALGVFQPTFFHRWSSFGEGTLLVSFQFSVNAKFRLLFWGEADSLELEFTYIK